MKNILWILPFLLIGCVSKKVYLRDTRAAFLQGAQQGIDYGHKQGLDEGYHKGAKDSEDLREKLKQNKLQTDYWQGELYKCKNTDGK